jgi:flagellar protein FlgJ
MTQIGDTPSFEATLKDVNPLSTPPLPVKRVPVVDRSQVDPQLVKAAEGMEAIFIELMLKEMRKTVQNNSLSMENNASKIYRGMMDHEMSQTAARTGGIGLADQIIAYLQSTGYTGKGR